MAACRVGMALGVALLASALAGSAQQSTCSQVLARARTLAERFQMAQAEQALGERVRRGCDVRVAITYLRGLQAAREASKAATTSETTSDNVATITGSPVNA